MKTGILVALAALSVVGLGIVVAVTSAAPAAHTGYGGMNGGYGGGMMNGGSGMMGGQYGGMMGGGSCGCTNTASCQQYMYDHNYTWGHNHTYGGMMG